MFWIQHGGDEQPQAATNSKLFSAFILLPNKALIAHPGCEETSPLSELALAFPAPQERIQSNFPPTAHETNPGQ